MEEGYTYNPYKTSKKKIINKSICKDMLEEMIMGKFRVYAAGSIISVMASLIFVPILVYASADSFGEWLFFPSLLVALVMIALLVAIDVEFFRLLNEVLKIKKCDLNVIESRVDYKTVEYVYKFVGGKYKRRTLVNEYVVYFTGFGRYVDSNSESSIFNTSQPNDAFYIVCANIKKPKYPIVFNRKYYQWEN